MNTVKVLGIPVWVRNIRETATLLAEKVISFPPENLCISATGAHGLVIAQNDKVFCYVLKQFYINLPDGMPSVWVGLLKGANQMERCYGPDFFAELLKTTNSLPIKHYFCGGNIGVADELKEACNLKFENKNICGTFCPPFLPVDKYDYAEIAEKINKANANVVWIGLSTPKQELFAYNLSKFTNVNFIICVGAAFDFHTDRVRQAPKFIQKIGMEWFFRLCMEPKRLYKRYIDIVPKFIYYNILDFTGNLKTNK